MNSTGVNTAGTLQTYPFTGYMSEPNAQDISMAELEVEVENIDVTFNQQSKTYQVFEVDFMKKAQHLLYRITPQIQSSLDKYRVPFFIVLGVCGALVIVVIQASKSDSPSDELSDRKCQKKVKLQYLGMCKIKTTIKKLQQLKLMNIFNP